MSQPHMRIVGLRNFSKQTIEPTKQSNLQIATPADNFTMTSLKKTLINTGEHESYTPFSSSFSHNKNIQ